MHSSVSSRSPHRAALAIRRTVLALVAVLAFGGVASLFFTGRATSELQQSRKRVESLNAEVHALENKNARLRAEIDGVKKSTYAVERAAREDLGMSRKGEVIYLLTR